MVVRAVIDTSSLVGYTSRRDLQQIAQLGAFVGIWSPWIIGELYRVLTWRWIRNPAPGRSRGDLSNANYHACSLASKQMMELLINTFEVVDPKPPYPPAWKAFPDEWDYPIWAAAVESSATYVVSENTHHFPPRQKNGDHSHNGITYLSSEEFLRRLAEGPL